MVAEVVHGAPYRFADPARFSLAHGGKDRHPFPVALTVYDQTIRVLKTAVAKARLGREEELAAMKRLDDQAEKDKVAVEFSDNVDGAAEQAKNTVRLIPSLKRICPSAKYLRVITALSKRNLDGPHPRLHQILVN
jgi:hypothetical protein